MALLLIAVTCITLGRLDALAGFIVGQVAGYYLPPRATNRGPLDRL